MLTLGTKEWQLINLEQATLAVNVSYFMSNLLFPDHDSQKPWNCSLRGDYRGGDVSCLCFSESMPTSGKNCFLFSFFFFLVSQFYSLTEIT